MCSKIIDAKFRTMKMFSQNLRRKLKIIWKRQTLGQSMLMEAFLMRQNAYIFSQDGSRCFPSRISECN